MSYKIPIYKPQLNGNEKKYVNECLDSSWISSRGEFIKKFEDGISKYLGVKHSTAVCNGTVALHLALVTLGIGKDDEVIVPSFTYIAPVSSIIYTGAKPVFVDSLDSTWQMNPECVRKKITNKTKAIMVVHIYGHPCEMNELKKIADEYGIYLIEDCAEALGSKYEGKYVGTFGDISTLSFYGNKLLTTGEGGMVLTNNDTFHDRANHLKMHGLAKFREYWHDAIGFNYRMTNICASIGLAQLENLESRLNQKRQLVEWYFKYLKNVPVDYHRQSKNVFHSYWMFTILIRNPDEKGSLRNYLKDNGIETRPSFYPVHSMPMFSQNFDKFPVAERISSRGINLPSFPSLRETEVNEICRHIKNYFQINVEAIESELGC